MYSLKEYIKVEINNNGSTSLIAAIKNMIKSPSKRAIFFIRFSQVLYRRNHRVLAHLCRNNLSTKYGIFYTFNTQIGIGLKLPHANGIIIGDGVILGDNIILYHQVTLGGRNIGDSMSNSYPKVEDNVVIYAGAKILGQIIVKRGSIVGANSVVTKDTDIDGVYAGIPAKKIRQK